MFPQILHENYIASSVSEVLIMVTKSPLPVCLSLSLSLSVSVCVKDRKMICGRRNLHRAPEKSTVI